MFDVLEGFKVNSEKITSEVYRFESNQVLLQLTNELIKLGFKVEMSKKAKDKIQIPVLFGLNGTLEKAFEADAYNESTRTMLEIESGRAVTNYQFFKNLFQACMMQSVDYLVIAVRNVYRQSKDFEKVMTFFNTLYASRRVILPLKGVLIIGY
ncbi:hypothetical protein [Bacillus cereus group sp. MYBK69-1]|uniref:hypothetical protein n=1 Tax=unclassified Bacillus cereus group TaxID=2750818 RepID=UPI003F7AB079